MEIILWVLIIWCGASVVFVAVWATVRWLVIKIGGRHD